MVQFIQLNLDFLDKIFQDKAINGDILEIGGFAEIISEEMEISQQGDQVLKALIQRPLSCHENVGVAEFLQQR